MMCSAARLGVLLLSSSATLSDAFSATLRQLPPSTPSLSALRVSKTAIPDLSSSTKPVDESTIFNDSEDGNEEDSSWQTKIDLLLAPDTNVAERQIVLSDLLSSGDEIQESVRTALRERKVSSGCGVNYIFAIIAMGTNLLLYCNGNLTLPFPNIPLSFYLFPRLMAC